MAERGSDRVAAQLLGRLGTQRWGVPPRLRVPLVAELGPAAAVLWGFRHSARYERTLRTLGPLRTHLACTVVSLVNGCRYSAHGHAYAAELVHLRERGALLPVDAESISGWAGLGPAELRTRLVDLLERAELHGEVLWMDRTLELASGTQGPVDAHEARVAHLVEMLGVLNAIAEEHDIAPDEAHDLVDDDVVLKTRHRELRGSVA
jgi:hypothetical protein